MNKHKKYTQYTQEGFSLIEVLVSLLVLSIGLLGVMQLQLKSRPMLEKNTQQILAQMLATGLSERLQSHKNPDVQKQEWQATVQRLLPNGSSQIECLSNCTIGNIAPKLQRVTIYWDARKNNLTKNQYTIVNNPQEQNKSCDNNNPYRACFKMDFSS